LADSPGAQRLSVQRNAKTVLINYLAQFGLRITRQRRLILEEFLAQGHHLHLDEFYPRLRAKYPGIGHATVYRALKLFAESGIAREIRLGDGLTRYEVVTGAEHHDHLVCTRCGAVTEFQNGALEMLHKEAAQHYGFRIEQVRVELQGVCSRCLEGENGPAAASQPAAAAKE
jgi:Fur family transcriptional regulator, ferric uptake regulator